jgi:hypothetical protein
MTTAEPPIERRPQNPVRIEAIIDKGAKAELEHVGLGSYNTKKPLDVGKTTTKNNLSSKLTRGAAIGHATRRFDCRTFVTDSKIDPKVNKGVERLRKTVVVPFG